MVRAAALPIALAALFAVPAQAAEAPSLAAVVKKSVFETCPSVLTGAITLRDPATLRKLDLTRGPPDLEQTLTHPRMGPPETAGRPVAGSFMAIAYYRAPGLCTVTFGGPDLDRAHQAIKAGIAAAPALYQADAAASVRRDKLVHQAFRYKKGGSSFLLTLASAVVPEPDPAVVVTTALVRE
ncbi:MAG: hypothetical protein ACXW27_04480 [Allosphingosinicella sp.]